MRHILKLNATITTAQMLVAKLDVRLLVFLIVPFSALAFQLAGPLGFVLSGLLLPAACLAFRPMRSDQGVASNGDGLTGLPTPSQVDALTKAWPDMLVQDHRKTACFMVQVDRFSDFLATHGDTAGFQLQRSFSERLSRVLRDGDLVTRVADGAFKCLIHPVKHLDLEICIHMANRIKSALESPLLIDGHSARATVSVGFCISGQMQTHTLASLEEGATIALAAAQRASTSSIRAFSPKLLQHHQNRKKICDEARDALINGEVVAWFQPQVSTETGAITGFEALARWQHPQHGIMPPGEFLDTLAESGQLEKLSEEMLRQSISAINSWDLKGHSVARVGINFSGDELHNPMLAERISWELDRHEMPAHRIAIEVLESVIAGAPDGVLARNLRDLAKLGCHIDLDDFGTGHAAISSVQRFSANRLKIDRSFVKEVDRNQDQQRLIAAIVTMAEQLGIATLAEGVETAGEHTMLAQLGCGHVQGFGIARPMPFHDTIPWMRTHAQKLSSLPSLGRKTG
ncbi:putative bifunctional diguanylate cyclase/phosphodiesterase [Cognatishimia sp.]|uniref:putative bifunctional diguanylate cyclase/phosphodiesterase n=1 Tax=Cognatishimia sp. TaxID=2211648 RepID=UPI0035165A2B